jgi:hypothetical protein
MRALTSDSISMDVANSFAALQGEAVGTRFVSTVEKGLAFSMVEQAIGCHLGSLQVGFLREDPLSTRFVVNI